MFFGGDEDRDEDPDEEEDDEEERERRARFGTRQPQKKSSKRTSVKPSKPDGPEDYSQAYDDLLDDVLGDESDSDSDSNRFAMFDRDKDKKEDTGGDSGNVKPFLLFDFRRGTEKWPEGCTMVDYKTADKLINQIKEEVATSNKTAKVKGGKEKMDVKEEKDKDDPWAGALMMGSMESWGSDMEMMRGGWDKEREFEEKKTAEPEVASTRAPEEAKFETLKDGSSALIIPAGTRLKLDLNALTTDKWKDAGKKKKKKKKNRWSGWGSRKWWKEYINEYTITMDVKFYDDIPRDGVSLFQTALVHVQENKKSAHKSASQSDGECIVNNAGGVGCFGSFGDVTKARIEKQRWRRIVVSVKNVQEGKGKGEMKTWIDAKSCATLKQEALLIEGRFAIEPDGFYLFSSQKQSMMPGGIAIRSVRVETSCSTDTEVKENRARDKVISMFNEEREAEVDQQRRGLALASVFPKPRPIWDAPALIATFGDAFIEGTGFEASSLLAWSYTVLNFVLQAAFKEQVHLLEGLNDPARQGLSDVVHIINQSHIIFKQMLRLLKNPSESQLMSFLRKARKLLQAIGLGESLLLPALIENKELLIIVERTSERQFRFVIVQTDPFSGLRHHAVSPAENPPKIMYRTCMVLNGVSKQNALDDVFWMAVFNLAIHIHKGDLDRFYDILLPFLTDKPLESSLVEAEEYRLNVKASTAEIAKRCGDYRSPQRSETAYVRCVLEALHYMLRARGLTQLETKLVHLALRIQFVTMIRNDLSFVSPDDNGQRVCEMSCRQLSYATVKLSDQLLSSTKASSSSPSTLTSPVLSNGDSSVATSSVSSSTADLTSSRHTFVENTLEHVRQLVEDVQEKLAACVEGIVALPPRLDLTLDSTKNDTSPSSNPQIVQFKDMLAWDVDENTPDPGQAVFLRKYIPIDMMQIPQKVTTRDEAVLAIRMCDKLCTLMDNQIHCVKNRHFLIANLIQYVFTQVVPVPKPRNKEDLETKVAYIKGRAERRKRRAAAKRSEAMKRRLTRKPKAKDWTVHVDPATGRTFYNNKITKKSQWKKPAVLEDHGWSQIRDTQSGDLVWYNRETKLTQTEKPDVLVQAENQSNAEAGEEAEGAELPPDPDAKEDDEHDAKKRKKKEKGLGMKKRLKRDDGSSDGENEYKGNPEDPLPDFEVGKEAMRNATQEPCVWDQEISYGLQAELLDMLQKLMEHFIAASYSIQQCRAFDAVCIIVPGVFCAIADAVLRQIAKDHISEISCHLSGLTRDGQQLGIPGFGLSTSTFSTQIETIEVHSPELNVARTAVIDYFQSPAQRELAKIFSWEEHHILVPSKPLIKFMRNIARDLAIPSANPHLLLIDGMPESSMLIRNFSELFAYRDLALWWKFCLNTDLNYFPNHVKPSASGGGGAIRTWTRMSCQMVWQWNSQTNGYRAMSFGNSISLHCRPDPAQKDPVTGKVMKDLPKYRFPSTATPSFYVPKPTIRTEDDVIYRPNLPSFSKDNIQILGQRDSELLISFLTVPYLRVPLVLTFFASEDRVHKLESLELRMILDSVMFEPGKYLAMDMMGVQPVMIPSPHPQLLASAYGLLLNELQRSPDTIIRSSLILLQGALTLDTGSVCDADAKDFNTSVDIILYVSRLVCRVESYVSFLVDHAQGKHDCIGSKLRDVDITPDCLAKLQQGKIALRTILHGEFESLLEDYLKRLDLQCRREPSNEGLVGRNSRLACDLHAHKLLLYRNVLLEDLTPTAVTTLVGSFVFLTTRHTWNKGTRESGRMILPEVEVYELLQVQRRRIVTWCRTLKQGMLDDIMQTALQISTSTTGSLRASSELVDAQNRWSVIMGPRSMGRYAVASSRTLVTEDADSEELPPAPVLGRQISVEADVGEVADDGQLGIEMDLQIGQMTLRSRHLSALQTDVANHPDVKMVFGEATMQASLLEQAENRRVFRLVGMNHELHWWQPHLHCPPLSDEWERDYDPAELFPEERWILQIWEPVRKSFFDGPNPPPMQFMMPEKALPENAEVAVLLGLHQKLGGPFKLVYIFRRLRCVHVYECVSQGRQWFWCLHLTTDVRFTLREMQPSVANRKQPFPKWWKYGAGSPYPAGVSTSLVNDISGNLINPSSNLSVLIVRDESHSSNLSGGKETMIPERLLYGLIPQCLLDQYRFWQDESKAPVGFASQRAWHYKKLRGYPLDLEGEYILIVELVYVGSWLDVQRKTSTHDNTLDATGLPGRTIRVSRIPRSAFETEFRERQQLASTLESLHLLTRPIKEKRPVQEGEDISESDDDPDADELEVGNVVEADYKGTGEFWPCTLNSINEGSSTTYDVTFTGAYSWAGVARSLPKSRVRSKSKKSKAPGEGIWHWDGMSDSEDQDWRSDGSEEEKKASGEDEEKQRNKDRLSFDQFNELGLVLRAAGTDVASCVSLLEKLHAHRQGKSMSPFTQVSQLVDAILVERKVTDAEIAQSKPFEGEMSLLNLLYAPRRSRLYSLLQSLVRVENASYIAAWTKVTSQAVEKGRLLGPVMGAPSIDLVELPRLKLAFTARDDHDGVTRLYSIDHADLFISNERPPMTSQLLSGIPHSLLLSNLQGEMQVLVPVVVPARPVVSSEPFSTHIVLDRSDRQWLEALTQRYFLYPVHVSLSFLMTQGINTALYLILLKFLHREYDEVFRLADSVASDTKLSKEVENMFSMFKYATDDWHPDSHACRLKMSLVILDSGIEVPWDLTMQSSRHVVKLQHVSANCRLSREEELQLLESPMIVLTEEQATKTRPLHDPFTTTVVKNRLYALKAIVKNVGGTSDSCGVMTKAPCWTPPRAPSSAWPYYCDNTVFGHHYAQLETINTKEQWLECLKGDETGQLVVVTMHVLWSATCTRLMPSIREVIPVFPLCKFVSVRADCVGLSNLAQELNVTKFPTIIVFREGRELPGGRVVGGTRTVEKLMSSLNSLINDEDRARYQVKLDKERAAAGGKIEEEEEESAELQWTWDTEHAGHTMGMEDLGMTAVLREEEEEDQDQATWEYNYQSGDWVAWSPECCAFIEKEYRKGVIFKRNIDVKDQKLHDRPFCISRGQLKITSREISGMNGYFNDNYHSFGVRRRGPRVIVAGEPPPSKEQAARDKQMKAMKEQQAKMKRMMRAAQRGKDVEAIRGTLGLVPDSGIHRWTVKWNHEPSRVGRGDGIGLVSGECEQYGPVREPCLGNAKDGSSIGFYASGDLFLTDGKVHLTSQRKREAPIPVAPIALPVAASANTTTATTATATTTAASTAASTTAKSAVAVPMVETTASAADAITVEDGSAESSEAGESSEEPPPPPPKEYAPCWGKGESITVCFDSTGGGKLTFEIGGQLVEDISVTGVFEMLGGGAVYPAICLCPFDREEDVEKEEDEDDDPDAEDHRQLLKEAKALNIDGATYASMDPMMRQQLLEKLNDASNVPSVTLIGAAPKVEPKETKEANADDDEDEVEETSTKQQKKGKKAREKDVPIDRVRWMWEDEKHGWEIYPEHVSQSIEMAKRENKSKFSFRYNGKEFQCKLTSKDMEVVKEDGKKIKLRRHVVGEGLAGEWELLSMKFAPPISMRGQAALETLEMVWSRGENMLGRKCGLGFLFLFSLLQGKIRAQVVSSGWGGWGGWGGWASAYSSTNDSHRYAVLLSQLFIDRRSKSLPASIINVLGRNKNVCLRMPKFKDTRKVRQTPVFNGWTDEREPRSPLADLFGKVVNILQELKKKRGAIMYPPQAPHPELPAPEKECTVVGPGPVSDEKSPTNRDWLRPELSDFGCDSRKLNPVLMSSIQDLADLVEYRLGGDHRKGKPPVSIEHIDHFDFEMEQAALSKKLVVVDFYATWCGPCKQMAPMFNALSIKSPTTLFLKVDIDECEELANRYNIVSLPTVKLFRGGGDEEKFCVGTIRGGGQKFLTEIVALLAKNMTDTEKQSLAQHQPKTAVKSSGMDNIGTDQTESERLAQHPLAQLSPFLQQRSRVECGLLSVRDTLPFRLEFHDASSSPVAKSMLLRMKNDISAWAQFANESVDPKVAEVDACLADFFTSGRTQSIQDCKTVVQKVLSELHVLRDLDGLMVQESIQLLQQSANFVNLSDSDKNGRVSKLKFLLRRQSGQEPIVWLQFLFGALLSSRAEQDLQRINPYLSSSTITTILDVVTLTVLRANRIGHTNRAIAAAIKLTRILDSLLLMSPEAREAKKQTLQPNSMQAAAALAEELSSKRHYIKKSKDGILTFDPRFLIFEFTWNILLRKKQVEIVTNFVATLAQGQSKCKQMIMGAGKTTVVAPLLALILADGKSLVLSVVPRALLEMSRKRMRETFATIMQKRIYTLKFDRSTKVTPAMHQSLENAVVNRGVVVSTPTSVKSVMLGYIECLQRINENQALGLRRLVEGAQADARELAKVLQLFRDGVMLLDEVDLILHPLKSELNFPTGEKFDLDVSEQGERWGLPIHLLDAVFFAERGKVSVFEQKGTALDILRRLAIIIDEGYRVRALQRLPHVTLLNPDFYHARLKPVMAEWAYLWLQKQHLHGIDRDETLSYMLEGSTARSAARTRVQLIDKAANHALTELGLRPAEETQLSSGHLSSLSAEEREALEIQSLSLQRQNSEGLRSDVAKEAKLKAELKRLQEASVTASAQQQLIENICEIDEELDNKLRESGAAIGEIQKKIIKINQDIEKIEFPRDDSLDNAVIVWLSNAFANRTGGDARGKSRDGGDNANAVHSLVSKIEDAGYSVRRCDVLEEAVNRARELYLSGRLRCVLVGGGEAARGCPSSCNVDHSGQICIVCNQDWGSHNGHSCNTGARGSFPPKGQAIETKERVDYLGFVKDLTDPDSVFARQYSVLPKGRLGVFSQHFGMTEKKRMACWQLGVLVLDEEKDLLSWVKSQRSWPSQETKSEVDMEDDLPAEDPSLGRQHSEGTTRLQLLRKQLEQLEKDKIASLEKEDICRKGLRAKILDKHALLHSSLIDQTQVTRAALAQATAIADRLAPNRLIEEQTTWVNRKYIGPTTGRDASYAFAWLDRHAENLQRASAFVSSNEEKRLLWVIEALKTEVKCLEQTALMAKVMAHVSLLQKKLLNLTHDWLRTFLPHCLAKVNRVSFGLLNDEECAQALIIDPRVPPSRLKLAVPFVAKDVPSPSSEFAHPDVIIGVTVLAYRYSGLRSDDFTDLVDALTTEFAQEIGPARDRASSRRHEMWVREAGGTIRGMRDAHKGAKRGELAAGFSKTDVDDRKKRLKLSQTEGSPAVTFHMVGSDEKQEEPSSIEGEGEGEEDLQSKEVVQLKYLQQSNAEQMTKLFDLWRLEPHVIHYYLNKFIYPAHMRSQHTKISASGQAVGGDMLVSRRVGFSGTPSDLLPLELGKCDYETGDDGKMLTTVLDPAITSVEHLDSSWGVDNVLQRIATQTSPVVHALIDTGALITGYTNEQVAQQLLKKGLEWCDGVVFLDDEDRQQVLVRATGRVVSADLCGIPLERRFAFYDQIHTTGMDIKHVVNARAVVTLGKDMVFRDYVQGAFRMRGIGQGQSISVYIIPEVAELMQRELRGAMHPSVPMVNAYQDDPSRKTLVDVVAWLVINSMRSEQIQWNMLCLQNVANVYRKNAFQSILRYAADLNAFVVPANVQQIPMHISSHSSSSSVTHLIDLSPIRSLEVFTEPIDFALEASVPDPIPFSDKLRGMVDAHSAFILSTAEYSACHSILIEVGENSLLDESPKRLDTEQEREQEQEQQKEVRARRDQQIEVEKFVEREYSRNEEAPSTWHISALKSQPGHVESKQDGKVDTHPFYPLSEFRLRYQEPLPFPKCIQVSRNYFNPKWGGLRRVKNVVMLLEWAPSVGKITLLKPEESTSGNELTSKQTGAVEKAFDMLRFHALQPLESGAQTEKLSRLDLRNAIKAATDAVPTEQQLTQVIAEFGDVQSQTINLQGFVALLKSGRLRKEEEGRYWVAVSLAEAETLRRILHVKRDRLFDNQDCEIALRYSPLSSTTTGDSGVVFDASMGWRKGTDAVTNALDYQCAAVHNCMRYFDGDMHYSDPALNVMVRALQSSTVHDRERFFLTTIASRRRMERKWQDTPLAKLFTVADEWAALKHRAFAVYMREAIKAKQLTLWEAFVVFDADNSGMLSPAEFYGAIKWLGVPAVTPEDVVDFLEAADFNRDGMIDYKEYLDMIRELGEAEVEEQEADARKTLPPKVEPFGADILREVIVRRKREDLVRQREDRLRQEAYQQSLDMKVFEEELIASKARKGGANPLVTTEGEVTMVEYRFTTALQPLRMVVTGKSSFKPMVARDFEAEAKLLKMTCPLGHDLVAYMRYVRCDLCGNSPCEKRCGLVSTTGQQPCSYHVCKKCTELWTDEQQALLEQGADKTTYLECAPGCSFSLQVPQSLTQQEDKQLIEANLFTVSVEFKIEKFIPVGHLFALLRFSPPELSKARRRHHAHVYIHHTGQIIFEDEKERKETTDDSSKEKDEDVSITGAASPRARTPSPTASAASPTSVPPPSTVPTSAPPLPTIPTTAPPPTTPRVAQSSSVESVPVIPYCAPMSAADIDQFFNDRSKQTSPKPTEVAESKAIAVPMDESESQEEEKLVVEAKNVENNEKANETVEKSDKQNKAEKTKVLKSQRISVGDWHVVSVSVDALKGELTAYVNGQLAATATGMSEICLKHKLLVLGGGLQAQARGASVRHVVIHNKLFTLADAADFVQQTTIKRTGKQEAKTDDKSGDIVWIDLAMSKGAERRAQNTFSKNAISKLVKENHQARQLDTKLPKLKLAGFADAATSIAVLQSDKYKHARCLVIVADPVSSEQQLEVLDISMKIISSAQTSIPSVPIILYSTCESEQALKITQTVSCVVRSEDALKEALEKACSNKQEPPKVTRASAAEEEDDDDDENMGFNLFN